MNGTGDSFSWNHQGYQKKALFRSKTKQKLRPHDRQGVMIVCDCEIHDGRLDILHVNGRWKVCTLYRVKVHGKKRNHKVGYL
jgi:hypothetical protein